MNRKTPQDVYAAAEQIAHDFNDSPFKPWNAGLASENPAVYKRVCEVLNALDALNRNVVTDDSPFLFMREFLRDYMQAQGYEFKVNARDKWTLKKVKK